MKVSNISNFLLIAISSLLLSCGSSFVPITSSGESVPKDVAIEFLNALGRTGLNMARGKDHIPLNFRSCLFSTDGVTMINWDDSPSEKNYPFGEVEMIVSSSAGTTAINLQVDSSPNPTCNIMSRLRCSPFGR